MERLESEQLFRQFAQPYITGGLLAPESLSFDAAEGWVVDAASAALSSAIHTKVKSSLIIRLSCGNGCVNDVAAISELLRQRVGGDGLRLELERARRSASPTRLPSRSRL